MNVIIFPENDGGASVNVTCVDGLNIRKIFRANLENGPVEMTYFVRSILLDYKMLDPKMLDHDLTNTAERGSNKSVTWAKTM